MRRRRSLDRLPFWKWLELGGAFALIGFAGAIGVAFGLLFR